MGLTVKWLDKILNGLYSKMPAEVLAYATIAILRLYI